MKVLLDASFLVSAVRFKVRVFEELRGEELYILDVVYEELKGISYGTNADAVAHTQHIHTH